MSFSHLHYLLERSDTMEEPGRKTKRSNNSINTIWEIVKHDMLELSQIKTYRELAPQGIVFVAFLFIYIVVGYFPKTISGFSYTTGDEPHYLVMTQSIANDGDFHLDNNYKLDLHKDFYNAPLDRHYIDIHGKNYSF